MSSIRRTGDLLGITPALLSLLLSTAKTSNAADVFVDLGPFPLPENISIFAGDTVVWRAFNPGDNTLRSYTNDWESPRLNPGETFEHTFTTPGTYVYLAAGYSPGTVTVQALTNARPVVSIVSPPDGFAVIGYGDLQAAVTIPEAEVKMVQFFDHDKVIGTAMNAPLSGAFCEPRPCRTAAAIPIHRETDRIQWPNECFASNRRCIERGTPF